MPDAVENAAPNGGDGNGDGTADSTQSHVASLSSETGRGYVTVVSSGGSCGPLTNVHALPVSAEGSDPEFSYPFGLIGFKIPCVPTGGSVSVTVILHGQTTVPPGIVYRKFGPVPPSFSASQFYTLPNVQFTVGQVGTTSETALMVSFTLTDGQLGDDTGADGMIVDPGGPAFSSTLASASAASPWGLAGLVLVLGAVAARGISERNTRSRS